MKRLSTITRITVGATLLTLSILLLAGALGLTPDEGAITLRARREFCETLAIQGSLLLNRQQVPLLRESLTAVMTRHDELRFIALRKHDGDELLRIGEDPGDSVKDGRVTRGAVPLFDKGAQWGTMDIVFCSPSSHGVWGMLADRQTHFLLFVTVGNALAFFCYLKRTLQHLDPTRVVPDRVRNALDTIAEGLVIIDARERIVLANKAFAQVIGKPSVELVGQSLGKFDWRDDAGGAAGNAVPWSESLQRGVARTGATLKLYSASGECLCYVVNSSPILADDGSRRGVLISFEDVTELKKRGAELTRTLEILRSSRDEIRRQNEDLRRLATQDPLTGCHNRRSFLAALESQWARSRNEHEPLSCIMIDVDHFKSINDRFGHSTGDAVLQKVAEAIRGQARSGDLVCRYGGEEFCVLLPGLGASAAAVAAEEYRQVIERLELPELRVTASLGVSSSELGATGPQLMIDEADKCLYVAKRGGRNQVVCWHPSMEDEEDHEVADDRGRGAATPRSVEVPYHAVSALVSALAFRDARTAEHSRRVADLCVLTASRMMTARECFTLEIAALLHDIGKLGVPDAILLKPGPLTPEEWQIMGRHDRVGVDIIDSAFACPALTAIVSTHHSWYGGNPRDPELPRGEDIPLGARILALADAYDAIVSDRVYRKGRSPQEAFAELRRCAGTQFDPALVEPFIEAVSSRYESRVALADIEVTRHAALLVGQQLEHLARSLDEQDLRGLAMLADGLGRTAQQHELADIATAARRLQGAVLSDSDLQAIVEQTQELIDLCRTTQSAFIRTTAPGEPASAGCAC